MVFISYYIKKVSKVFKKVYCKITSKNINMSINIKQKTHHMNTSAISIHQTTG